MNQEKELTVNEIEFKFNGYAEFETFPEELAQACIDHGVAVATAKGEIVALRYDKLVTLHCELEGKIIKVDIDLNLDNDEKLEEDLNNFRYDEHTLFIEEITDIES